ELDIEIFALDRPAVAERVFPAGAHRPTGTSIALLMTGTKATDLKFGHVDFGPRSAAGHVHHRLVPPGHAELTARGDEPTLLRLRNEAGAADAGERPEARFEILALFVGRGAVALEADDPLADLIVAAALEAADEAGEAEVACNAGSSRGPEQFRWGAPQWAAGNDGVGNRAMSAPSGPITRARANIAATPGVDRNGRRRWCRSRRCEFGSHCRRRSQAQRDQRYA